jgi:hypothetical protein
MVTSVQAGGVQAGAAGTGAGAQAGNCVSAGHAAAPEQDSARSQTPADGRQTWAAERIAHVPLTLAPAATEQAWQSPGLFPS